MAPVKIFMKLYKAIRVLNYDIYYNNWIYPILYPSLNKRFDCIWAMNTLLHVPKSDLCEVLKGINLVLKEDGLFFMGVYGGKDTEGEYAKSEVSNISRFFSSYSESCLKAALENYFQIIAFQQFDVGTGLEVDIFQSVIMRKK